MNMKFVVSFIFIFLFSASNIYAAKPKINKNTQVRVEYGCRRTKWGTQTKTITAKYKNLAGIVVENYTPEDKITLKNCIFSTRHWVLFNTSIDEPQIEVKQCKNHQKKRTCCKVLSGRWKVFDGKKNVLITNPAHLQIDHILPFSYIRLNMKDCKLTNKYYNYLPNLKPELASVNLKKSNNICQTAEECEMQTQICKAMAEEFEDKRLCEEIDAVARRLLKKNNLI